ncbi:MAG: hypothetical protein R6V28_03755 [Nitriliruptoraceae bacterium]
MPSAEAPGSAAPPPRTTHRRRNALTIAAAGLVFLAALAVAGGSVALRLQSLAAPEASPVGVAALTEDAGFTVWQRNADGTPVRWDPCTPIEVVWSATDAPATARADIIAALERVSEASGLTLRLTGSTEEEPSGSRLPYQPERYGQRWAPVLIAWADPAAAGLPLRDTDRGVAVPIAVGPDGDRTFVTGQVLLNAQRQDLRPGFEDRADSWGATLVHEFLHVLGLGHVDDPSQLMHVYPGRGPVVLGDGDRAGLTAIGPAQGCREVPPAAPVTVAEPPSSPTHGVP